MPSLKEELINEIYTYIQDFSNLKQTTIQELNIKAKEAGIPSIRLDLLRL